MTPRPARIGKPHGPQGIVDLENVLGVEDGLLVTAGDDSRSVERLVGSEAAVGEAADGVLAADEEALTFRDTELFAGCLLFVERVRAALVERQHVAEAGVDAERALAAQGGVLRQSERRPGGV